MSPEPTPRRRRAALRRTLYSALGAGAAVAAVVAVLFEPDSGGGPPPAPPKSSETAATPEVAAPPVDTANQHRYAFAHRHTLGADRFDGVISPTHPTWSVAPGLDLERVATGLTYPVNLAFAEPPPRDEESPWLYVDELHGAVKWVSRSGRIETFASGLLNFEPVHQPKTDETGLSGLAVIPGTRDLLVTTSYEDERSGLLINRVLRLVGKPDGRSVERVEVLLELDEYTSPSNQIQQIVIGPDKHLYIAVGDAENHRLSLDLDKYGGKILRVHLDGKTPRDNPFYDPAAPDSPRSRVFAYGLRNVFDFDFDPLGKHLFAGDNGKDIDRFTRVDRGASYHWNGVRESIRLNALYSWSPAIAPCGFTFLREDSLGPGSRGDAVLAAYGPPGALGRNHAKTLLRLRLDAERTQLGGIPQPILQYTGDGRATVLGVAEGPGGVYFTDFFGETRAERSDGLGNIYRVVPSEHTKQLARGADDSADPTTRGRQFFFDFCTGCHRLGGIGGSEGPDLTAFGDDAVSELQSKAYEANLTALLSSTNAFMVAQRPRLEAVREAKGRERVRVWLENHLEEPRFDNPRAKMPSMTYLTPEVHSAIIDYLMTQVPGD